jgi:hypothetical protein
MIDPTGIAAEESDPGKKGKKGTEDPPPGWIDEEKGIKPMEEFVVQGVPDFVAMHLDNYKARMGWEDEKKNVQTSNKNPSWSSSVDWKGVLDSSIGIAGGTAEVVLGVAGEAFTAGLSTALIVDGVFRIGTNSFRLVAYLTTNGQVGNALPSNLGGMVGKITDGVNGREFYDVGPWQIGLGVTNDIASFVATGGNGSAITGVLSTQGLTRGAHLYSIGNNYYTVWNYGNQRK